MVIKMVKTGVLVLVGGALIGGLFFGKDVVSYARSSARSVQTAVKDAVPIEFELKRARDMLEEIIPEMHANIKLIAQEEVEIAALKGDIERSQASLTEEQNRIKVMRTALVQNRPTYRFANQSYNHNQVKTDLAARFERYKEAELVLTSKQHLLSNRQTSLQGALQMLDQTRSQKRLLEDKISALEGQYRLVKAASTGTNLSLDNSQLAKTEKIISQIKKRLDVAERVLAHESRFVQTIPVETVVEQDLLDQIDEHFEAQPQPAVEMESQSECSDCSEQMVQAGPLASIR